MYPFFQISCNTPSPIHTLRPFAASNVGSTTRARCRRMPPLLTEKGAPREAPPSHTTVDPPLGCRTQSAEPTPFALANLAEGADLRPTPIYSHRPFLEQYQSAPALAYNSWVSQHSSPLEGKGRWVCLSLLYAGRMRGSYPRIHDLKSDGYSRTRHAAACYSAGRSGLRP